MTDKLFHKLWFDALNQSNLEMYVSEYGYPDWFDEISPDSSAVIDVLEGIHKVAHMSIRDMISQSGLTQSAFAIKFCIPLRTVEDWATGKRKCADYTRLMIAKELGLLKLKQAA